MVLPNSGDKTTQLQTFVERLKEYQIYFDELRQRKIKGAKVGKMECLREELLETAGSLRSLITDLTNRETITIVREGKKQYSYNIWFKGLGAIYSPRTGDAIAHCIDVTIAAIGKLKDEIRMGIRDKEGRLVMNVVQPPSAFIAHKGESPALNKLKGFLDALGVKYLIAEDEPSNGRSVDEQVEWTSGQANFAIILATKGGVVDKQTRAEFMGMNVADELGMTRERFGNRFILLLEEGVEPHTNINEIVHERFSAESMDKAFTKIVKELTNWHLLRASKH